MSTTRDLCLSYITTLACSIWAFVLFGSQTIKQTKCWYWMNTSITYLDEYQLKPLTFAWLVFPSNFTTDVSLECILLFLQPKLNKMNLFLLYNCHFLSLFLSLDTPIRNAHYNIFLLLNDHDGRYPFVYHHHRSTDTNAGRIPLAVHVRTFAQLTT